MLYRFFEWFINFGENCYSSLSIVLGIFFFLEWMVYGFHYLSEIHNASTVHWFWEFWWFRDFLRDLVILGSIMVFVWFLFSIVLTFFCLWWLVCGFLDLEGIRQLFHRALFLKFWWFRGFLEGLVILEKIEILLWFFTIDYFTNFWIRDGLFMDEKIFSKSRVLPRCIVFSVLVV